METGNSSDMPPIQPKPVQAAVNTPNKKSRWLVWLGGAIGGVILILASGYLTLVLLKTLHPKQASSDQTSKKVVTKPKQSQQQNPTPTAAVSAASLPPVPMATAVAISDTTKLTANLPDGWATTTSSGQTTSAANKSQAAVITYGVLDMKTQYDPNADNAEASLNAMNLINAVLNGRAIDGKVSEIQKGSTFIATSDQKGLQLLYKWFEYSDKAKTAQRTEVAIRASGQKYIIVFYTSPKQSQSQFNQLLNAMKVEGVS